MRPRVSVGENAPWVDNDAATRIDPALIAHFAVLRRSPNAQDDTDHKFVPALIDRYGLLPHHARMILLRDQAKIWIVPGSRGAALSREAVPPGGRGSHFGTVAQICDRGLWSLAEDLEHHRSLAGLVPDGNPAVGVVYSTGDQQTIPTVEGIVFLARIDGVREVVFRDTRGRRQRQEC